MHNFKKYIEKTYPNIKGNEIKEIIFEVISQLDKGTLRVTELTVDGWKINEWIKKSIIMYFSLMEMKSYNLSILEFYDKIPLKIKYKKKKVRVIPTAIARYGSHISYGVILMPSYVNIGAYIGANTMIDTWATIGSCAQVGSRVHISGGVGIGGVLEPMQAKPVIIEDDVFIGSRCILVEGVHVEEQSVLGAGVVITGSTKIIDITGINPIESVGLITAFSVVIPGTYPRVFSAGIQQVSCIFIIGKRKKSTDRKTSLNETLRSYKITI